MRARDVDSLTPRKVEWELKKSVGRGVEGNVFPQLSTQTKSEHLSLGWASGLVFSSTEGVGF